jgi:tetratricopeptide (TPR) repeat protein
MIRLLHPLSDRRDLPFSKDLAKALVEGEWDDEAWASLTKPAIQGTSTYVLTPQALASVANYVDNTEEIVAAYIRYWEFLSRTLVRLNFQFQTHAALAALEAYDVLQGHFERLLEHVKNASGQPNPSMTAVVTVLSAGVGKILEARMSPLAVESFHRAVCSHFDDKTEGDTYIRAHIEWTRQLLVVANMQEAAFHSRRIVERARQELAVAESGTLASCLNVLGVVFAQKGQYTDAFACYAEALVCRHVDPVCRASVLNNVGLVLQTEGQLEAAHSHLWHALHIRKQCCGDEHPYVADSFCNLGTLARRQGNVLHAQQLYTQALTIYQKFYPRDNSNLAAVLHNLGLTSGDCLQVQAALDITKSLCGERHPDVGVALTNLAAIAYEHGDTFEAQTLNAKALAVLKRCWGDRHPSVALTHSNQATMLRKAGKPTEALLVLEQSVRTCGASCGGLKFMEEELCLLEKLFNEQQQLPEAQKARELAQRVRVNASQMISVHNNCTCFT